MNEEGRRINVITLEEDAKVLANKQLRSCKIKETKEVRMHRSNQGKTKKGEQQEISKVQKRRHITQHDFCLVQHDEEYDLVKDISTKKPDITYG